MPILSTKPSALNFLYKIEIMKEVVRREKEAGITPDPNIDTYMKVCADGKPFLCKIDIMKEVSRREKEAGITPDPDIDSYMKVCTD